MCAARVLSEDNYTHDLLDQNSWKYARTLSLLLEFIALRPDPLQKKPVEDAFFQGIEARLKALITGTAVVKADAARVLVQYHAAVGLATPSVPS